MRATPPTPRVKRVFHHHRYHAKSRRLFCVGIENAEAAITRDFGCVIIGGVAVSSRGLRRPPTSGCFFDVLIRSNPHSSSASSQVKVLPAHSFRRHSGARLPTSGAIQIFDPGSPEWKPPTPSAVRAKLKPYEKGVGAAPHFTLRYGCCQICQGAKDSRAQ